MTPAQQRATDKRASLKRTIDERIESLAKSVDAVRASESFMAYLDMQARFHKYSFGNTMLIMSQCAGATRVAGFRTWQGMGRQVRKGERGLYIFAPMPWKSKTKVDANGDPESGISFRAVAVFDVSQTDGEELPKAPTCEDIECSADDLLARFSAVASDRGYKLELGPIGGGAYGSATRDGKIAVDNSYSTGQQAKTLAHELAHQALHFGDKALLVSGAQAELEAESVAYVVCQHFGLDSEIRSAAYIALWQGNGKALRESLQRIQKTSAAIIDDIETPTTRKAAA